MSVDHKQIDWVYVERSLEEGTYSGYKFAVVECEKILQQVLRKKYPYIKNIDALRSKISKETKFPDKLKYIQSMHQKITTEPGFDVSAEDTKNIISGYYQIVNELARQADVPTTTKDKVQNYFHKLLHENIYTRYFMFLLIGIVSIAIISNTNTGTKTTALVIASANFAFFKVIVPIVCISVPTILLICYFKYRKKKSSEAEEETRFLPPQE